MSSGHVHARSSHDLLPNPPPNAALAIFGPFEPSGHRRSGRRGSSSSHGRSSFPSPSSSSCAAELENSGTTVTSESLWRLDSEAWGPRGQVAAELCMHAELGMRTEPERLLATPPTKVEPCNCAACALCRHQAVPGTQLRTTHARSTTQCELRTARHLACRIVCAICASLLITLSGDTRASRSRGVPCSAGGPPGTAGMVIASGVPACWYVGK